MQESSRRRVLLDVPWRTIVRILAAAALVWCVLRLVHVILLLIVAVLLAVLLDPVVRRLERRGLPRGAAAAVLTVVILLAAGAFVWTTWASLADQSKYVASRVAELQTQVWGYIPDWLIDADNTNGVGSRFDVARVAMSVGRSATTAVAFIVFGFAMTVYLLFDGHRTYAWLIAFVPRQHRWRVERTLADCQRVAFAYMAGNVITSVIATIATWIALWLLNVPAALLLALLAGLSDFVPVVGFILSAIPAVLLAFTVSPSTAVIVVVFYIAYNAVENYVISPRVYGDRMKLSDLAVILALAIGAELAGVIGALIALPLAAMYPTLEQLWLREELPDDTVRKHRALESGRA
jgi:predicted PurR-regulated permease PerM